MSSIRISTRYAKSLLDLTKEQGKLDRVLTDINAFIGATSNHDLVMLLKSPIVPESKKVQVMEAIFGDSFDATTMAFLRIIIKKRREEFLPDIAKAFVAQYMSMKNITAATIITANALPESTIADIIQRLTADGVVTGEVDMTVQVDPTLIGGFVLEFGDKRYDASISHKLETLRKEFSAN